MINMHAALELSGTNPHKRDTIAMCRIHVGLYFEDKAGKIIFFRADYSGCCGACHGRGRYFHKASSNSLTPKLFDGAAEEKPASGRLLSYSFQIKRISRAFQQSDFVPEFTSLALQ